jgi:hypothetical protein
MTIFKKYLFLSRYRLPYSRLHNFECRIESPLPSENLALSHIRDQTPIGFWNNGLLGEILYRLKAIDSTLPSTPLSHSKEIIRLAGESVKTKNLYITCTFYEGLDSADYWSAEIQKAKAVLIPDHLFITFDYVPLIEKRVHEMGLEKLVLSLAKSISFTILDTSRIQQKIFSESDTFIHLHNKILYYYSPFEVIAKMNGANVLYHHPTNKLHTTEEELQQFSFLLNSTSLDLHHLELLNSLNPNLNHEISL